MTRTPDDLHRAALDAEAWLDGLDLDDPSVVVRDAAPLRRVATADRDGDLAATRQAVAAALADGWSWTTIATVLDRTVTDAQRRYAESDRPGSIPAHDRESSA